MQLGQLFGSSGFTSPLTSDFLDSYKSGLMGQIETPSFAGGAFSTSPGATGIASASPLKPPGSSMFPDAGITDEQLNAGMFGMMKDIMSPEYRKKLMKDKLAMNRAEMNQAMQGKFMSDLANKAGEGARAVGNVYGQAGANIASILGGTRLPSPAIQSGGTIANVGGRKYFG